MILNILKLIITKFIVLILLLGLSGTLSAQDWQVKESENFKLIFKDSHEHLSDYILSSAEKSLEMLSNIFNYESEEKTIITIYDIYDYGFGAANTTPQNIIRLEIEPFEPGYENIPYNERISWLLNHELVHIIVNDKANPTEDFLRSLFGKVYPDKQQPLTIFYSLLTNHRRFTPRWHQEGIAVFLETWLSGGYGRILGNFDEMYFRSLTFNNKEFATSHQVDSHLTHMNYLLDQLNYIYGARFTLYLGDKYGYEKLIKWYGDESGFYQSFKGKFEEIYGIDLEEAWQLFIESEKEFQKENITKLAHTELSKIDEVSSKSFGAVSQPYFSPNDSSVIYTYHKPDELSTLTKINLFTGEQNRITTIPTPSVYQVTSSAFDSTSNLFFYTSNNNQLFRDLNVMDLNTHEEKTIFENYRIGNISVSPRSKHLWAVQHNLGMSSLVVSEYPYNQLLPVYTLNETNEFVGLSVSPDGKTLAAVIHEHNGTQSLYLIDVENLLTSDNPKFKKIIDYGSPENPSWSGDMTTIYFDANINGVSNIYRYDFESEEIIPLSNTMVGLFKPIEISKEKLFCFEFSTVGFKPVIISRDPVSTIKAIDYHGQKVVDANPKVKELAVDKVSFSDTPDFEKNEYFALSNLHFHSFVPTISGFQKRKVLGFFARIGDPTLTHDLSIDAGVSPFDEDGHGFDYHLKIKYDYKKELEFIIEHNSPYFYDLFNDRKKGLMGNIYALSHNYYWVFDNPYKLKQKTSINFYDNLIFFIDNVVKVSQPDFLVAQTELSATYLRRSIGSIEYEAGYKYLIKGVYFLGEYGNPISAGQIHGDISFFNSFLTQHNVFHFNFAAGYHFANKNLYQARFFLGGFGNRIIEDKDYKQYRSIFRFPGIPIYSVDTDKFIKLTFENNLPPIWLGEPHFLNQYPVYIDMSIYSQSLFLNSEIDNFTINLGAQVNFHLKNWYNLESTLSFGIAKAWFKTAADYEWFVSFKLLKN